MEIPGGSQVLSYEMPQPRRSWKPVVVRVAVVCALLLFSVYIVHRGLTLRWDAWTATAGVRFEGDVANGFNWGQNARQVGLFNLYHYVQNGYNFPSFSQLDYTPLRLAVVYGWARWNERHYSGRTAWENDWDFTAPMLWMNISSELASAVLIFVLIRLWVIRHDDAIRPPEAEPYPFRGVPQGMIGALFFWFNPAVIWDGHCWPQWDIWLVPFFLAAVLLACLDWWFVAGLCIIIGANLKGQMLLGAPILFLWPLCQLRFGAFMRLLSGFMLGGAFIAFPWMHPSLTGTVWYILSLLALALMLPFVLKWKLPPAALAILTAIAVLLIWPWKALPTNESQTDWYFFPVILLSLIAATRFLHRSLVPHAYALAVACIILLLIPLHGASSAWYDIGFTGGAENYRRMLTGTGTYNLPALLRSEFGSIRSTDEITKLPWIQKYVTFATFQWLVLLPALALVWIGALVLHFKIQRSESAYEADAADAPGGKAGMLPGNVLWTIFAFCATLLLVAAAATPHLLRSRLEVNNLIELPYIETVVGFRTMVALVYAIILLLVAVGAAIHYRRSDPRFLVAMAVPWVLFYVLLPQMHGRYLVWGAAMSALLVGANFGLGLLGIVISCIAWMGILTNQYAFEPAWDPENYRLLRAVNPHMGWMLLLATAILLYYAILPRSLRGPRPGAVLP